MAKANGDRARGVKLVIECEDMPSDKYAAFKKDLASLNARYGVKIDGGAYIEEQIKIGC